MQGLLRRESPSARDACQAHQQQWCERHGGDQHHRSEVPPRLEMVVDDAGEALKVVVAEEAVPEGLTLHQQLQDVPGQADRRREGQTGDRPQTAPGCGQIAPQPTEQKQCEAGEYNGDRSLGQDSQSQNDPGLPPPLARRIRETPPLQQQADGQEAAQKRVAHGGSAPDDHQR
ncbi:MAG: Uncharacterised protein [Synechococcus sp. CC9902]|nr:MAG: Uncharacterised protein [Synechococcus sp. CC9902]